MGDTRNSPPTWITAASAAKHVDFDGAVNNSTHDSHDSNQLNSISDFKLSLGERAVSAAGAAVISAIIVNPLDVAKTRLQAQAAGIPYHNQCDPACFDTNEVLKDPRSIQSHKHVIPGDRSGCARECSQYRGTLDVFTKVLRQEGFSRLWRGTNASLTLAIPTVGIYLPCYDMLRNYLESTEQHSALFKPYSPLVAGSAARVLACITCYPIELARTQMQAFQGTRAGFKPPGVWKTLLGVVSPTKTANHFYNLQNYRLWWTGLGAQLARDVPFSAICWGTLEPIRRRILGWTGDEVTATRILGANFAAGFIAGSLAAGATCPLDVARTRRQIEKDRVRQLKMTTSRTLVEIWRSGGWKGLFIGITPRVARAGPSVGIVVSSYEVAKYALYHQHNTTSLRK